MKVQNKILSVLLSSIIMVCFICFFMTGCMEHNNQNNNNKTDSSAAEKAITAYIKTIDTGEGELVFDISIEEFIDRYNSLYKQKHQKNYLADLSQWDSHGNCYEFSEDRTIWSLPKILVYTPDNGDYIQEVSLDFDDHSYSDALYEQYEKMCFYTMKAFFPEFSNDKIKKIYTTLNNLGSEHIFLDDQKYSKETLPYIIYYKDGIGIYPYFIKGSWMHLCFVPVNDEILQDYKDKGTIIERI